MSEKQNIVVYSKETCTYCSKAKSFLDENKIPYIEVKLDPASDNYSSQRQEIIDKTLVNHTTFPFIFVGTEFLGGYSDLVNSHSTLKLHDMCEKIGIVIDYDF